ncbi:BamA/TamA family outer membrane protein [Fluviibacterium sp. DFM31]|uniref:BamA/TamA family outer membrane protein n=1 Tax=Meridianimarinicoccus marinus TaxID=3231483 RepID=A0ABV3L0T3_9RHOB
MKRPFSLVCATALLALLAAVPTLAQDAQQPTLPEPPAPSPDTATASKDYGFGAGSMLVVPIPLNSPTFGTGLILGAGYVFQEDEKSDNSFIGAGALATNNGSRAGAIGASLSLDEKRHNGVLYLAAADVTYDLYVAGDPLEVNQDGVALNAEYRYGFTPQLLAGLGFQYLESRVNAVGDATLPPGIQELTDITLASLGLVAQWDTRNDSLYPTKGGLAEFNFLTNQVSGGASFSYLKTTLALDHYWSLGPQTVLAANAAGCLVEDEAPFFDSCLLGSQIRGFSLFQYYGDQMVTAQAELRQNFTKRFGGVAFAGVGETLSSLEFSQKTLTRDSGRRYAGGLGLRFRVSKDFPVDLSLDVAINDLDEKNIYFYVGQAF